LDAVPYDRETTLSARTVRGGERQEHRAASAADAPDPSDARLPPPAPQRFIDRIDAPRRDGKPTQSTGATGLLRVAQALGNAADRPRRAPALAPGLFSSALHGPLRHPARLHLDEQPGQPLPRPAQGRPQGGALRCAEPTDVEQLAPAHPLSG